MIACAPALSPEDALALVFPWGVPGLEEYRRFTLLPLDDVPVYLLQSDDEPAIALPLAEARTVADNYVFDLADGDAAELGLTDAEAARVLIVLSVAHSPHHVTANLLAPIVVNQRTGVAKQVILEGSGYGLHHPVAAFSD